MSKARARLFELAEFVRKGDDAAVILEQRGHVDGIALVREARLEYLEDRVSKADQADEKPFRLAGSMSTDLSADELLALMKDLRKGWDPAAPVRRSGK
jgi:hypothetical protein